jgi:soluble lytic murein transglycosylase-like protein
MIRHLFLATILLAFAGIASSASAQHRQKASLDANGNLDALIASHAAANNVPMELVRRVIKLESGGIPRTVSKGNYGLMQIKLGTARAMGYRGDAAGLLDPNTNLIYAVKYLAGAYRAAGGNADRAMRYYASGYYNAAKSNGRLDKSAGNPLGAFASDASGNAVTSKAAPEKLKHKVREAKATGANVASSSNPYTGKLDYY